MGHRLETQKRAKNKSKFVKSFSTASQQECTGFELGWDYAVKHEEI